MKQPNILFILSDDHAANAISLYGSRLATVFQTPNLDRIGKEGALFTRCYCTNSICTPSRATILTGQYSHVNGVRTLDDPLDTSMLTYPLLLQRGGYQTAIVGKWHVHTEPQGFDYYDVLGGQGLYFDPNFQDQSFDWNALQDRRPTATDGTRTEGYVTDIITDKCLSWLETLDPGRPFALMCHHKSPHAEFEYHPRDERLFDGVTIPEPDSLWEDKSHRSVASRTFGSTVSGRGRGRNELTKMIRHDHRTGTLDITGMSEREATQAAYQKYLKDYLRTVKAMDDNVGRIIDYLDGKNLLDDTLVLYTSDQGMFLGEHDYNDKRWIYTEAFQMPLLVRFPREVRPGSVVEAVISNIDFAPTLLDYAGLEVEPSMPGRSFRGVLQGQTPSDWPGKVYYRYWMHLSGHDNPAHIGICNGRHKLIFFYGLPLNASRAEPRPTPPGWELYDLQNDPEELHNVYNDPACAEVVQAMKDDLLTMKEEVGDIDTDPEMLRRLAETP